MSNDDCKSLTFSVMSTFQKQDQIHFFTSFFDFSEEKRELMKISDSDELANWFHDFDPGFFLPDDFSMLRGYNDAVLYEFMKKVIDLGEKIVVSDSSFFDGNLVGKIIPDKEKPTVIVDWFDYDGTSITNDFCMKIGRNGEDESIHIACLGDSSNCNVAHVAIVAGKFYEALELAIRNSKDLDNSASYGDNGYPLRKKM